MPENEKYLNSLIIDSLSKFGSNIALQNTSGKSISYSQLKQNCIDHNFFSKLFNETDSGLVAVYSEKSSDALEIIFSVLLSSNSYLPLDFYSPADRILHIVRDSGARALVLENKNSEKIVRALKMLNVVFATEIYNENYSVLTFKNFRKYTSDTAYVLYTSGSTGKPKGVVHSHASACSFVNWSNTTFNFEEGSRFLSVAPFSFDISVLDIYSSLSCGGTLFIPTHAETSNSRLMAKYIAEQNINVVYSTPTFFRTLKNYGQIDSSVFDSVNYLFYAGEQLNSNLVLQLAKHFPKAKQFNLYGPTETNVCCFHEIDLNRTEENKVIPIGKACSAAKFYLEENDADFELFVASKSLMTGYVNGQNNFVEKNDQIYYDTGDLVTKTSDGTIIFKGRKDKMLKRNGYRIEIAEIESCISSFDGMKEHSIAVTDKDQAVKIVIFFVADQKISELQLREFCLQKIPAYMMPDYFVQVEALNMNTNFKTDLNKLLNDNDFRYAI